MPHLKNGVAINDRDATSSICTGLMPEQTIDMSGCASESACTAYWEPDSKRLPSLQSIPCAETETGKKKKIVFFLRHSVSRLFLPSFFTLWGTRKQLVWAVGHECCTLIRGNLAHF